MKTLPVEFQPSIYDGGNYLVAGGQYSTVTQIRYSRSKSRGMARSFLDSFEVLENLSDITTIQEEGKDQYLFFAVPYSEGWHATVDGKDVDILRANTAFMAIPVSQGAHTVELSYTTPYLLHGACISAVSIVLYAGILVEEHRKKVVRKGR